MLSLSLKTNISADDIRYYASSFKKILFSKKKCQFLNTVSTSKDTVGTIIQPDQKSSNLTETGSKILNEKHLSAPEKPALRTITYVRKQPLNKEMFTLPASHIQFIHVIPIIFEIRVSLNTGNILKYCLCALSTLTVSLFSALTSIIPFNNAWQSGGIKWGI